MEESSDLVTLSLQGNNFLLSFSFFPFSLFFFFRFFFSFYFFRFFLFFFNLSLSFLTRNSIMENFRVPACLYLFPAQFYFCLSFFLWLCPSIYLSLILSLFTPSISYTLPPSLYLLFIAHPHLCTMCMYKLNFLLDSSSVNWYTPNDTTTTSSTEAFRKIGSFI